MHEKTAADYAADIDRALDLLRHNHTAAGAVFRVILEVQKQTLAFVAGAYVKLEELENNMDVSGFGPIVQKLNDTATSLAASAQAISAGNSAAQADQQQLNAALASLGTAVDGVATAAKAVADAVSPTAHAQPVAEPPTTPPQA